MDPILKQTIIAAKKKRLGKVEADEAFIKNWARGVDNIENNLFKVNINRAIQAGSNKVHITGYDIPKPYAPIVCDDRVKLAYNVIKDIDGIEAKFTPSMAGDGSIDISWTDIELEDGNED